MGMQNFDRPILSFFMTDGFEDRLKCR